MSHVQFLVSIFVVSSCIEEILPICSNHASLTDNMFADQELRYHSIYETSVISPYECADVCLRDARCRSFNFKRKQNSRDVNICEINDIKWEKDHAGLVWPKQGTDIYNVGSEDLRKVSWTHRLVPHKTPFIPVTFLKMWKPKTVSLESDLDSNSYLNARGEGFYSVNTYNSRTIKLKPSQYQNLTFHIGKYSIRTFYGH